MKILALRLENLASLAGPLELDFTAVPLSDANLFAITGPTGAGKSTLLDALCLALYGSTPRLRQAPSRDSQIDDTSGAPLTTSDARTLLRRGTVSGYAEVDFVGIDGRRYRARWAVRRARDKANGRLQAAEQSLSNLDDGRLLTAQKREFERLLPERLGLTFEQFTRAVLLAQSEFAAFLQADDNARSDLLERLTGTAEYSRISMAAYQRTAEANKRVTALEAKLADDLPAEPNRRDELEHAATATQQALTHLQAQEESLKARLRWHDNDHRLSALYRQGVDQQQAAEQQWQTLANVRRERGWRHLIASQRHAFARHAALPNDIAQLETRHAHTRQALQAAQTERQAAATTLAQTEQALAEASEARQQAAPLLHEARQQAQQLATLQQQITDLESARDRYQTQLAGLSEHSRQAAEAQRRRQQQRDDWQASLSRLVGTHPHLDDARQAAQNTHDQTAQRQLALNELTSHWQEYVQASQTQQRLNEQQRQQHVSRERLLAEGRAARQRLDEALRHLTSISELIERSRAVRSASVAQLREQLRENASCPVCGGLEHPWRLQPPTTPEAAQLAAQHAEETHQLNAAQTARDTALEQRDTLVGEFRAVEAALAQGRTDLNAARQRHEAAQTNLESHRLYPEFSAIDAAERSAWLAAQRETSTTQRQQARDILDALARAAQELAPLEAALREDELLLTRLSAERAGAEQPLAELDQRLPPLRAQHTTLGERFAALLGEHASPEAWQQWLDSRQDSTRQARDEALTQHHTAGQAQQQLTQRSEHEAQQHEALRQELATLDQSLTMWRQQHAELDDATLQRLLAQSDNEAQDAEQRIDAAEQARQRADATLGERRQALLDHRRGQALAADEHDDSLLAEQIAATIQQQREALDVEQQALHPQRQHAQQARDTAVHALHDDDRRRQRQQAGQAELEAARNEYRRWAQISELIGSADGKTFRRIAQAYNLEQLLEHANAHLAGLSRRYRLARGGSPLGLLVIDHDMGDERRSVHSLSGGETFLVSLALALGLASMASGELTIESLFIDEGFGSLDPQSLALAMEALDGLQALGRRVGVISHVQEMHERIPVQIRVEPLGNGASQARITMS